MSEFKYTVIIEGDDIITSILHLFSDIFESNDFYVDYGEYIERFGKKTRIKHLHHGNISEVKSTDMISLKYGLKNTLRYHTLPSGEKISVYFDYVYPHICLDNGFLKKKLEISAENKSIIQKIIYDATEFSVSSGKLDNKINVFMKHNERWKKVGEYAKRPIDKYFHPKKHDIIADIETFLSEEQDYIDYGIPYKRNYLFYGPPGCGKTSLISVIAAKFDYSIYLLPCDKDLDDESLKYYILTIPKKSILVLEDFDYIIEKNINISTFLNMLDGHSRNTQLISILTTNNRSKLSSVFTRPGRIDYIAEFTYITEEQFDEMFRSFRPKDETLSKTIFDYFISEKKIAPCIMQKFLFETRKVVNIITDEYQRQFESILEEYNQNSDNKMNFYM